MSRTLVYRCIKSRPWKLTKIVGFWDKFLSTRIGSLYMNVSSLTLTLMTCWLLLSCSNASQDSTLGSALSTSKVPQERTSLRQLADCEDYRRSFTNSITRQLLDQGLLRAMPMMMEMAVSSDVSVSADDSSVPTSITGTNSVSYTHLRAHET